MKKALAQSLFTTFSLLISTGYADQVSAYDASALEYQEAGQEEWSANFESNDGNVIVNSRPLSLSKKALMDQQRKEELKEAENLSEDELEISGTTIPIKWKEQESYAVPTIPIKWKEEESYAVPTIPIKWKQEETYAVPMIPIKHKELNTLTESQLCATAASFSPYLFHWLDSTPQNNIVKLEDGSEWILDKKDIGIVREWKQGDALVVSPKNRFFWGSNYAYTLTNKETSAAIDVNLFLGPIAFGSYSTWVIGIDYNTGQVYMLNGEGERTVWEVASQDLYLFEDWGINDTLIVGENNNLWWWFSSHNHILVNVNMNHFVRAKQVSAPNNFRQAVGLRG